MSERDRLPEVRVTARSLPDAPGRGTGAFAVGSIVWRDRQGHLVCTVVAKASYRLKAGASAPIDPPPALARAEVHHDEGGARSVLVPNDLVPFKESAEVVVVGAAFGDPVSKEPIVARVAVGSVDKSMSVFPPRLSLRDEVAALGPAEQAWLERPADAPIPATFPGRYFQAAPRDQWLDRDVVATESFVLEGLDEGHARLVVHLAGVEPRAFVAGQDPLRLEGDLLFIDTERALCSLTFRGQIRIADGVRVLRITVIGVPPDVSVSPEKVRRMELDDDSTMPIQIPPPGATSAHDLPFVPAPDAVDAEADDGAPTLRPPDAPHEIEPPPVAPPAWVRPSVPDVPSFLRAAGDEPLAIPTSKATTAERAPEPLPLPAPVVEEVSAPAPDRDDALPLAKYPAPRCAEIAARLAMRPDQGDAILEEASLAPAMFSELDAHWLEAIKDEMRRGKKALLSEYDAAFVAALEAERGPITAAEYARLVLAIERGSAPSVLEELRLPPDATMRVRRVFLERTAKDPTFARAVRAAIRDASR